MWALRGIKQPFSQRNVDDFNEMSKEKPHEEDDSNKFCYKSGGDVDETMSIVPAHDFADGPTTKANRHCVSEIKLYIIHALIPTPYACTPNHRKICAPSSVSLCLLHTLQIPLYSTNARESAEINKNRLRREQQTKGTPPNLSA